MKIVMLQSLRATLAVLLPSLLLFTVWQTMAGSGLAALPERMWLGILLLLAIGVLVAITLGRLRSEDRIARLEVALCREQSARSQADEALAESDLLLGRLTGRADGRVEPDPVGQLAAIQTELLQIQQQSAAYDPMLAARVELLCTRVERVTRAVRAAAAPAAEPG